MRRIAAVLLALAAAPASAFIPEGGVWWNPAESGRGLTLEVQDNVLIFSGYLYRADGAPTWVTSAGPITYTYNSQGALQTVVYSGQLDTYSGGQCLGCPYRAPVAQPGAAGPVRIDFRTETEANLTWGGQTIPIERFAAVVGDRTARMQGEWQAVLDFRDRGNTSEWPYRDYPFFGEVLLIDGIDRARNPDQFLGCRPQDTETRCTSTARRDHDVAGYYDTTGRETLIVVKDIPGTFSSPATYFAYFVNAGIDQFDGVVSIFRENGNPENGPFYPVRGFRSASRTYAQTGFGPASADDGKADVPTTGLSTRLLGDDGQPPAGLSLAEAQARTGIDIKALAAQWPQVLAGMKARAESAD